MGPAGWIRDIRTKTKGMNGSDRAEYIAEYYWYHILLIFAGICLLVLVVYHVTLGRRTVSFACIIVNERVDYERDSLMAEELAQSLELPVKSVRVDSDYRISYPGHEERGNNESDYEKFFFGWSQGELDAVIMPESFLSYCEEVGGELIAVAEDGTDAVPLSETPLLDWIGDDEEDPMMVIFPSTGTNRENAEKFFRLWGTAGAKYPQRESGGADYENNV